MGEARSRADAPMVDIHSHALPGVDDGATSMEQALAMLRGAWDDRIGTVVLTPHFRPEDGPEQAALHEQRFTELRTAVSTAGLPIEIHLGAEIGFRFKMAAAASLPACRISSAGRYVLVDLPHGPLPTGIEQGFFELRLAGVKPILAHPERHRQLSRAPEWYDRLREQDLLFQVTAGSITGRFGSRAQQASEYLLDRGWADLAASDAHDLEHRPFGLSAARERVEELWGEEEGVRLFETNPNCVVLGEEFEMQDYMPQPTESTSFLRRLVDVFTGS